MMPCKKCKKGQNGGSGRTKPQVPPPAEVKEEAK